MKKINKQIIRIITLIFNILWLIRVPIVSVSILLLINAFALSGCHNWVFPTMSIMFMLFFGYIINDILDIEIDRISAPRRPLPSGNIKASLATKLMIIFIVMSIIFAILSKNSLFFVYVIFYGFMFWVYTKYLKNNWFIKNIVTALFFSSLALIPMLFNIYSYKRVLLLFLVTFIFTFGREMLMDVRDSKGDKIIKNNKRLKKKYSIFLSTSLIVLSFILQDIFFFSTYIYRYICIVFVCFMFTLIFRKKERLWIITEGVKIAFLINLIFLLVQVKT